MNHNAFCDNNFDAKFTKIGNLQCFYYELFANESINLIFVSSFDAVSLFS